MEQTTISEACNQIMNFHGGSLPPQSMRSDFGAVVDNLADDDDVANARDIPFCHVISKHKFLTTFVTIHTEDEIAFNPRAISWCSLNLRNMFSIRSVTIKDHK